MYRFVYVFIKLCVIVLYSYFYLFFIYICCITTETRHDQKKRSRSFTLLLTDGVSSFHLNRVRQMQAIYSQLQLPRKCAASHSYATRRATWLFVAYLIVIGQLNTSALHYLYIYIYRCMGYSDLCVCVGICACWGEVYKLGGAHWLLDYVLVCVVFIMWSIVAAILSIFQYLYWVVFF